MFVVTHQAPDDAPENGVYEFAAGGIYDALERARAAAGDQTLCVMGGASLGQRYIAAGLIDEVSLHIIPVIVGDGSRPFERMDISHIYLETEEVVTTPDAIHVRYKILKQ